MEDTPITLAHNHARNAVLETRRSNPVAASEEHDLAAAEFAAAAQNTADAEARRTLHLLEQHHKKLGQILKFRHEHPQLPEKPGYHDDPPEVKATEKAGDSSRADASKHLTALEGLQHPPRLAGGARPSARDLSSSIASNLASARGIPGGHRRGTPASPTISAQHVPGKFAKDQAKRAPQASSNPSQLQSGFFTSNERSTDGRPSWAPPSHVSIEDAAINAPPAAESTASLNDAPFQQFYNTLESLMSKLSAPLAFAGLPLASGANTTTQPDKPPKPNAPPQSAADKNLDYSQLISRAALRAVQDGQHPSNNPAESFYVVPTTGGTISYAGIMTRADREASSTLRQHTRHLSNLSEDTMEDFVDANETLPAAATTTPTTKPPFYQKPPPSTLPRNPSNKTLEELSMQNTALRQMTDQLSRRLHVFEASAQSSSAALAYSIRSLTALTPSPDTSPGKTASRDDRADARIRELEDILRKSDRELARRERENLKLKDTVGRYREKWEKLKEGARARRGDGGAGGAGMSAAKGDDGVEGGNAAE